jgi:hypothetical protein
MIHSPLKRDLLSISTPPEAYTNSLLTEGTKRDVSASIVGLALLNGHYDIVPLPGDTDDGEDEFQIPSREQLAKWGETELKKDLETVRSEIKSLRESINDYIHITPPSTQEQD